MNGRSDTTKPFLRHRAPVIWRTELKLKCICHSSQQDGGPSNHNDVVIDCFNGVVLVQVLTVRPNGNNQKRQPPLSNTHRSHQPCYYISMKTIQNTHVSRCTGTSTKQAFQMQQMYEIWAQALEGNEHWKTPPILASLPLYFLTTYLNCWTLSPIVTSGVSRSW